MDLQNRLTSLYNSTQHWTEMSDQEWVRIPAPVFQNPSHRRPASADQSRRRHKGTTTPKRFENWYSSNMSEHIEKKKKALQGNGTAPDLGIVTKQTKKISEEEFQRWYRSALHSKESNLKHLKEKYSQATVPMQYKKFDSDKFDQWYDQGVRTFQRKVKGVEKKVERRDPTSRFDAEHFQTWYEHQ